MFSKQLYGRLDSLPTEGRYGCWQVNLQYEDEIPGKTVHFKDCNKDNNFESAPFFVAIEI